MTDYADLEKRLREGDLTCINAAADALAALTRDLEEARERAHAVWCASRNPTYPEGTPCNCAPASGISRAAPGDANGTD